MVGSRLLATSSKFKFTSKYAFAYARGMCIIYDVSFLEQLVVLRLIPPLSGRLSLSLLLRIPPALLLLIVPIKLLVLVPSQHLLIRIITICFRILHPLVVLLQSSQLPAFLLAPSAHVLLQLPLTLCLRVSLTALRHIV